MLCDCTFRTFNVLHPIVSVTNDTVPGQCAHSSDVPTIESDPRRDRSRLRLPTTSLRVVAQRAHTTGVPPTEASLKDLHEPGVTFHPDAADQAPTDGRTAET